MSWGIELAERGFVPDPLARWGMRRLLAERLRESRSVETAEVVQQMRRGPIALETVSANAQHYEVPASFFETVLGEHLKYSCCYWPEGTDSLDDAEALALAQVAERAGIEDGMEVLDLGCGWGSLTLWIAKHYPNCRILAVSNSGSQGDFIRRRLEERGLGNGAVRTADMNDFDPDRTFDRVVSIEMFEHARNYARLLERIAGWLAPEGRLFVHVFCHRERPYFFEDRGSGDWIARHFFTGGVMPSETLMEHFAGPVDLEARWKLDGTHYERTARAWLARLDARREQALQALASDPGGDPERALNRWRLFFLACAEMFGYNRGREWFVSQTLWSKGAV